MLPGEQVVAGLDLSLRGAGLCVLSTEGLVLDQRTEGYDLAANARRKDRIERHLDIARVIVRTFRRLGVAAVAVEHYAFGKKSGRQIDLAELRGVVESQLWLTLRLEPISVPSSSARKAVLGRGNIAKEEIGPTLMRERGLAFQDHNAADAYVVAEWLRLSRTDQPSQLPLQGALEL